MWFQTASDPWSRLKLGGLQNRAEWIYLIDSLSRIRVAAGCHVWGRYCGNGDEGWRSYSKGLRVCSRCRLASSCISMNSTPNCMPRAHRLRAFRTSRGVPSFSSRAIRRLSCVPAGAPVWLEIRHPPVERSVTMPEPSTVLVDVNALLNQTE